MRKITMEVELDDSIAEGLNQMQFRAQRMPSGKKDVWDARMWIKELIDRYEQERPH